MTEIIVTHGHRYSHHRWTHGATVFVFDRRQLARTWWGVLRWAWGRLPVIRRPLRMLGVHVIEVANVPPGGTLAACQENTPPPKSPSASGSPGRASTTEPDC